MQALAVRSSLLRRGAMAFSCALLAFVLTATASAAEKADKAARPIARSGWRCVARR
jgi:hypothetical protein